MGDQISGLVTLTFNVQRPWPFTWMVLLPCLFFCRFIPSAQVKSWNSVAQLESCRGTCRSQFAHLNCDFCVDIWKRLYSKTLSWKCCSWGICKSTFYLLEINNLCFLHQSQNTTRLRHASCLPKSIFDSLFCQQCWHQKEKISQDYGVRFSPRVAQADQTRQTLA